MSLVSRRIVPVVIALAALGGCAHDSGLSIPDDSRTVAPLRRLSADEASGLVSVPWQLAGSSPVGRAFFIQVRGSACFTVQGTSTTVTAADETLALLVSPVRCATPDSGRIDLAVELPEPLGTRQLRHAPTTSG
jgi:ABC-type branched-subunit amino acid transport system substrate-binding protein